MRSGNIPRIFVHLEHDDPLRCFTTISGITTLIFLDQKSSLPSFSVVLVCLKEGIEDVEDMDLFNDEIPACARPTLAVAIFG